MSTARLNTARLNTARSVRLIATDLDGTLLLPDKTVSERTREALAAAAAAGVILVAATGRQLRHLPVDLGELHFDYAIGANGGIGVDLTQDAVLFAEHLDSDSLWALNDYLRRQVPEVRIAASREYGEYHLCEPGYLELIPTTEIMPPNWRTETVPLAEVLSEPTIKVTLRHPGLSPAQLLNVVSGCEIAGLSATISGAPFVEIGAAQATKAIALSQVCSRLGVPAAHVMAIGDSLNDMEMVQWAGHGFAMGNADPQLRAVANRFTTANVADGFAEAVQNVLQEGGLPWNPPATRS